MSDVARKGWEAINSDSHHLHSFNYGLFVPVLIPQKLGHLSYFILYWIIYESTITGWSLVIFLPVYARNSAAVIDCLSLILQE